MIAHLTAIKNLLSTLGYTTHLIAAPAVTEQYLVLGGKSWDVPDEMPVCGQSASLDTDVRVTAVAGTPEGVAIMLGRVRGVLSPNLAAVAVPLTGRNVLLRFSRSEFIGVDRDETITGTSRHPAVGVDTYSLASDPA